MEFQNNDPITWGKFGTILEAKHLFLGFPGYGGCLYTTTLSFYLKGIQYCHFASNDRSRNTRYFILATMITMEICPSHPLTLLSFFGRDGLKFNKTWHLSKFHQTKKFWNTHWERVCVSANDWNHWKILKRETRCDPIFVLERSFSNSGKLLEKDKIKGNESS